MPRVEKKVEKKTLKVSRNPSRPLLNVKHEKFARAFVKTASGVKAYEKVWGVPENPRNAIEYGSTLSNTPHIRDRINYLLTTTKGLSVENLTTKHAELLDAQKPIILDDKIVDYPDNQAQLKALEMGYELHGALNKGMRVNIAARRQEVSLGDLDADKLAVLAGALASARSTTDGHLLGQSMRKT